jgi:exodeoxyribonuclease VII small subunit
MTPRERRTPTESNDSPASGTAGGSESSASYEQARDELAEVVAALEAGGLSLDESLRLWERGEELARMCTTFLQGARARVEAALAAAEAEQDAAD